MDKLDKAQDRALELLGEIGDGLRKAVPGKAIQWVETGAAIGVVKTGARVATKFVRRNPILATAAIAGAGLLWYCLLYTSPSPRDRTRSRMPSSA